MGSTAAGRVAVHPRGSCRLLAMTAATAEIKLKAYQRERSRRKPHC
jgi:hypothetical protein